MGEREYYCRMILIPLIAPAVGAVALWLGERDLFSVGPVVRGWLIYVVYYGLIGLVPYLLIAIPLLVWISKTTVHECRRISWLAPPVFVVLFVLTAALFFIQGGNAIERLGKAAQQFVVPLFLVGYAYIVLVHSLRGFIVREDEGLQ